MSSTEPVPETRMMPGDELSADDALAALRHYGRWPLLRDASSGSGTATASATPAPSACSCAWPSCRS